LFFILAARHFDIQIMEQINLVSINFHDD